MDNLATSPSIFQSESNVILLPLRVRRANRSRLTKSIDFNKYPPPVYSKRLLKTRTQIVKCRLLGIVLFIIFGGLFGLIQIYILTLTFYTYDTVLIGKMITKYTLKPPNFSFCFDIMRLINTTKLFTNFPDILKRAQAEQQAIPYLKNWTLHQIITEHELGEKFVLSMLTVAQLSDHLLPISTFMDKCAFLTSSTLTMTQCNSSYFQTYLFNCLYCFEFTWFTYRRLNMTLPTFNSKGLRTPGYHRLRLIDIHFNLSTVSGINEIITMAHEPARIPWTDESELHKLQCPPETSIVFGLTYQEQTKFNLPKPFSTECTDQDLQIKASADQSCWHNCSSHQFSELTGFYPRYSIVVGKEEKKILDSYHKQERYITLIKKLQSQCVERCGRTECKETKFPIVTVYRPSRPNPSGQYVVIHLSPTALYQHNYQLVPAFGAKLYWASVQSIISFLFGVNYHTSLLFLVDTVYNWTVSLYLKAIATKFA